MLLNLALYFILLFPQVQHELQLAAALKELEQKKAEARNQLKPESIHKTMPLAQLKEQLPPAEAHFSFLQQLQRLEEDHQVIIESVTSTERTEMENGGFEQGIYSETLRLSLKGSYDGIERFIASLYQLNRITEIASLEVRSIAASSIQEDLEWRVLYTAAEGEPAIHASILMRLYFTDDEQTLFEEARS